MATRDSAPLGAPCWADLWTSDVEGSRIFYSELFGWEAQEPSEEFGGYFMFTREGAPVAGGMGHMGEMRANDSWKIYFAVADAAKTLDIAEAAGAQISVPAMNVADLGTQGVLVDPAGAPFGIWQAISFPGFTTLGEPGSPSWFELHTRSYGDQVDFYSSVLGLEPKEMSNTEEFRYTTLCERASGEELAGVLDASGFLPEGVGGEWSIYWDVADVDKAAALVEQLGGSVVAAAETTPYGRIATVSDPTGALFRLRSVGS